MQPHAEVNPAEQAPRSPERQEPLSIDSPAFAHLSARLKKIITLALKMQERVDEKRESLEILDSESDPILTFVKGTNCHKAVLYALGAIDRKKLGTISDDAELRGKTEIRELGKAHAEKLEIFSGDVTEFANAHPEEYPFSIHIFLIKKNAQGVEYLDPWHSLLLLGVDAYGRKICFHKTGYDREGYDPSTRFELATLEDILTGYDDFRTAYLILPADAKENKNEN